MTRGVNELRFEVSKPRPVRPRNRTLNDCSAADEGSFGGASRLALHGRLLPLAIADNWPDGELHADAFGALIISGLRRVRVGSTLAHCLQN